MKTVIREGRALSVVFAEEGGAPAAKALPLPTPLPPHTTQGVPIKRFSFEVDPKDIEAAVVEALRLRVGKDQRRSESNGAYRLRVATSPLLVPSAVP